MNVQFKARCMLITLEKAMIGLALKRGVTKKVVIPIPSWTPMISMLLLVICSLAVIFGFMIG